MLVFWWFSASRDKDNDPHQPVQDHFGKTIARNYTATIAVLCEVSSVRDLFALPLFATLELYFPGAACSAWNFFPEKVVTFFFIEPGHINESFPGSVSMCNGWAQCSRVRWLGAACDARVADSTVAVPDFLAPAGW